MTDVTQPIQSLHTLFSQGSQPGYTVKPSPIRATTVSFLDRVRYLSIQSSVQNGNNTVIYVGDENLRHDGTCQGAELNPGIFLKDDATENSVHLGEVYLSANQNNLIANVEIHYA